MQEQLFCTCAFRSNFVSLVNWSCVLLSGNSVFVTLDRLDVADFIAATSHTDIKFIFKAPPLSYVTNVFTLPFDNYVWYSSYAVLVLILGVLYLVVWWEWYDPVFQKKIEDMSDVMRPKLFDIIMAEVGCITQQGSDKEPKSFAGRIGTILTLMVLMFLYTSYSANIVALLQSTDENIRSLEDLYTSRISLGVEDIAYSYYYFEVSVLLQFRRMARFNLRKYKKC